eukprot:18111_1
MGNNLEQYKWNNQQLTLLKKIHQDLHQRSVFYFHTRTDCISKEIFLEYFELPGIYGERLFNMFDTKKRRDAIDLHEFVDGITTFNNASKKEQIKILFNLYKLNDNQEHINRQEFSIILRSAITPTISLLYDKIASLTHGYIKECAIKYNKYIPFEINSLIISFYGQQLLIHNIYINQNKCILIETTTNIVNI